MLRRIVRVLLGQVHRAPHKVLDETIHGQWGMNQTNCSITPCVAEEPFHEHFHFNLRLKCFKILTIRDGVCPKDIWELRAMKLCFHM